MISHYYLFLLGYCLCWCCESKKDKISACENTQRQGHQTALKEKKSYESSIPDTKKGPDSGTVDEGKQSDNEFQPSALRHSEIQLLGAKGEWLRNVRYVWRDSKKLGFPRLCKQYLSIHQLSL